MATLNKHGIELARIEKVNYSLAYMSDGQVMKNDGSGWKLWRKVKAGMDVAEVARNAEAKYAEKLRNNPTYATWRKLVHDTVPRQYRYALTTAVSMMPDDPDGVWSEMDLYGCPIDLDDAVRLCMYYGASINEVRSNAAVSL